MLIENLFQKGIYGIGTVRANRKQMAKMIDEKHISKGRLRVPYSGNAVAYKWMDNRSMLLLSSGLKGINGILSVQRREKGSKIKSSIPFPNPVCMRPKMNVFCTFKIGPFVQIKKDVF